MALRKSTNHAQEFEAMKERILRNAPNEFGGAFVIVAPNGDVVSSATFDPDPNLAAFWALVSSAVQTAAAEVMQRETQYERIGVRR